MTIRDNRDYSRVLLWGPKPGDAGLYLGVLGNNLYFLLIIILRNSKNFDFCYGSKLPNV